jgi:hypothetical protein
LRIEAENLGLGGVVVLFGHLPHRQSLELAAKADALLVILGTGAGNEAVYPGKIFEYLRLGKPVLSLGPRESICGSLVKSLGRGIHADAGDLAAVKAGVLTLYTRWGSGTLPRFSPGCETEQFERRQTARQFAEIFDGLTPP